MASEGVYRGADEREDDLWVFRAPNRKQMGEAKEPEKPDRSMFT